MNYINNFKIKGKEIIKIKIQEELKIHRLEPRNIVNIEYKMLQNQGYWVGAERSEKMRSENNSN